jgi:hypothetical protein
MSEKDQYEDVCKREFQDIKDHSDEKFKTVQESLNKFYTAIFEGNGTPSLKSQVELHGRTLTGILWLGGVLTSAVVVCVVELWFKK